MLNFVQYLQHYGYFRFIALGPFKGVYFPHFCTVYGRFPPEARFNEDQVPLLFPVPMGSTCTVLEDSDIHISYPSESLRKRQFVMRIIVNTEEGEYKLGYATLACKGSPNGQHKQCEIASWDDKVPMLF